MITHLLTRIDLMMNSFSKGQKRIALYIEEHYDKAAFMTASKLGETVGVSESTVVRFATELGYDGYPRLQKAMQEMIRNKLTSVQRIEVTSSRIGNSNVLDSVLNQDIDKIRRTIEETSHEDFNRAVDEICNAKRIYIFGILVRDTTTIDPPLPESFKHDDELRDLISYVKTELKDSEFTKKPAIYSIYIYETEKSYSAEFNITGITTLEESNEAFLVFRRYLDEHPDYFLNEGYDLSLDMAGDVKVARNTYEHRTIEYSLNTSNPDDIRIKMSPGMIPEEIPEYSGFIDAKVVSVD